MPKIRMLVTVRGSPDGVNLYTYEAGSEHDLSRTEREEDLAAVFLRERWAALPVRPTEHRDAGAAPENKDEGPAPENKRRRGK